MSDDTSTVVPTWRIGACSNCLVSLNPEHVTSKNAAFCSLHCRKQAEKVRYVRAVIRDGRISVPMTRDVIYNNMIVFLALDLAYVRPQLPADLRKSVLARNNGRCAICNSAPAAEVDHIRGGSSAPENLRGLCRHCHEAKPRGPIPDDLTRDGNGAVDFGPETRALQSAWRAALLTGLPLDEAAEWSDLRDCVEVYADTRFGWVTNQILCDEPVSPAHRELTWRTEWPRVRKEYINWAKTACSASRNC
mgnify:CR=1 FL=1